MVNFNGDLVASEEKLFSANSSFLINGDALIEPIRVVDNSIIYWEEHYFRLMASMRILRMQIPMNFTMEYLEEEIQRTIKALSLSKAAFTVELIVARQSAKEEDLIKSKTVYIIKAEPEETTFYTNKEGGYEVELFKDYYFNTDMLSTINTTNKIGKQVAKVFAYENNLANCLLLNFNKQVIAGIEEALFLVKDQLIKTPPISDGAPNTVIRKKLVEMLEKLEDFEVEEASISPFELQKADELFLLDTQKGITAIGKYRKKEFKTTVSTNLQGKLNAQLRLASLA